MLKELDQNSNMASAKKNKLTIHRTNLFYPVPLSISKLARSADHTHVAVIKDYIREDDKKEPLSFIEIYQRVPNLCPKLKQTRVEYETLTGIAWVNSKSYLTVSRDQTISIYDFSKETKVFTTITDYGPITCMRYSDEHKLLVTGTEYGYVAAYRLNPKGTSLELVSKMVKVNGKIRSIDFACRKKIVFNEPKKSAEKQLIKIGKRKRKASSGEDSSDDDHDEKSEIFLADFDVSIFGASESNVIVWDFHRKTIVETICVGDKSCTVLSLLGLKNSDILTGDSTGTINIFDHKTFTSKMNSKVLQSGVLCLAEMTKKGNKSRLLISGEDPVIVHMKKNDPTQAHYTLVDKYTAHTHAVTCLMPFNHKVFMSGSLDGRVINFEIKKEKLENGREAKVLSKTIILQQYQDQIKFSNSEMMIQDHRSLKIWKLPTSTIGSPKKGLVQEAPSPVNLLLIKSRAFIHSSIFSERWIVYSTRKGLYIFDRLEEKLKPHRTNTKLGSCRTLELCPNNRYLFAASERNLSMIDLHKNQVAGVNGVGGDGAAEDDDDNQRLNKCMISKMELKSNIQQMLYCDRTDQMVVLCAWPKQFIYSFCFNPGSEGKDGLGLKKPKITNFREFEVSFMTCNAAIKRDNNVYIYTNQDEILRLDLSAEDLASALNEAATGRQRIIDLPTKVNILGMIIISRDVCILHDRRRLFKVDMSANKVINEISNYDYIVKMDNFLFQKPDQVALVELKPEDYIRLLPAPSANLKSRFGDA